MRKTLPAVFCLLLLAVSIAHSQTAARDNLSLDPTVTPHKEIDELYGIFGRAYDTLDPVLVANLYSENALYVPPGGTITKGRSAILKVFENFFSSVKKGNRRLQIDFHINERSVSGDMGYEVGVFTLTSFQADGTPRSGKGRFVVVLQKERDGVWRFQLDSYHDMKGE